MKRLFWTSVVFIVPAYFVIVLLASYIPSLGRSSTPTSLISAVTALVPWLVGFFVLAASLDWIIEQNAKSLITPMLAHFDRDRVSSPSPDCEITTRWMRTNMFLAMVTGSFHGRWLSISLHDWLGRSHPSNVTINVGCACPWQFEIRHRSLELKILGTLGEEQIQTNVAALDERLVFEGDNPAALREWVSRREVQQRILSLLVVHGLTLVGTPSWSTTIPAGEPNLQGSYGNYSWWNSALVTTNMPGVLEDLDALAQSLESLTSTRPQSVAC
jgi:hypothetical protein